MKEFLGSYAASNYSALFDLGRRINQKFNPETYQFRGVVRSRDALDEIIETGTDARQRAYTHATHRGMSSHHAITHTFGIYVVEFRNVLEPEPVIAVLVFDAQKLVPDSKERSAHKYTFKTSPKDALTALLYLSLKDVSPKMTFWR